MANRTYEDLINVDGEIRTKEGKAYGAGQTSAQAQAELAADLGVTPQDIEWGRIPKESRDITSLKAEGGDVETWANLRSKVGGQVAADTPVTRFNYELKNMLKDFQGLGTAKFQTAASLAREKQAGAVMKEATPGMSPGLQAGVRAEEVGAISPEIIGAERMGQTFAEQIKSFGDIMTKSQGIAQSIEDSQRTSQKDERDLINYALVTFGGSAFDNLDSKEIDLMEKTAGYGKGFISNLVSAKKSQEALALKTKEVGTQVIEYADGRKALINTKTGEVIQEYGAVKVTDTEAAKTIKVGDKVFQWNPSTGAYDIPVAPGADVDANKAILQTAEDGITLLDKINDNDGLSAAVGPTMWARDITGWAKLTGQEQSFIGDVEAMLSTGTLTALINAKAQGATFGALSDKELELIGNSFSRIKTWQITNKAGKVTGYSIDEKSFRAEIARVRASTVRFKDNLQSSTASPGGIESINWDFNTVGSDTQQAVMSYKEGDKAGQCGRFVNQIAGLGVGDSYASKMAKMDKSIKTPAAGMVFLMPYFTTGHTGIIVDINQKGIATVRDSNWNLDEKILTHTIPIRKMTGFAHINKLA